MGKQTLNLFDLVGVPYLEGGMDPATGVDCWGCVRYVLNAVFGFDLKAEPPSVMTWPDYVKIYKPPPAKLELYDVLMFSEIIPGLVNHVGIVCSAGDFIHSGSIFGGVVCEPIARYAHRITSVGRPIHL